MRLAALLEGGSWGGPWAAGDSGQSFGPFQIYTAVHNVSRSQAEDPAFAVHFMAPEFAAAAARLRRDMPGVESSEPMMAAALVAFWAEKPAVMYPVDRIRAAWDKLTGGQGDQGGGTAGTGAVAEPVGWPSGLPKPSLPTVPNPASELGTLAGLLTKDVILRGALGLVGVGLVAIGLIIAVGLAGGE